MRVWLEEQGEGAGGEVTTEVALEHRLFAPDALSFTLFDWDAALERLAKSLETAASP